MFEFLQGLLTPARSPNTSTREALDADMMKWYGELEYIRANKPQKEKEQIVVEVQEIVTSKIVSTPPAKNVEEGEETE
jgi:hypothetical protein